MATADQYAEWIVNNQSKKGSPEFETVASAYKQARAGSTVPPAPTSIVDQIPVEGPRPNVMPQQELTWAEKNIAPILEAAGINKGPDIRSSMVGRVAEGMARPGGGIAQLLTGGNQDVTNRINQARQQAESSLPKGDMNVAGYVGEALSPTTLIPASRLATPVSMLGKVAQGVGIGGAASLAAPVGKTEDFAKQKLDQALTGMAIGGLIPPALWAGGKLLTGVYNTTIEPWLNPASIKGRALISAAGDKYDEVVALLKANKQIVPGSLPTAGEAASPAGATKFSALQESARGVLPDEYLARTDAGNAARIGALRTVGQDEQALQQAIADRANVSGGMYREAGQKMVSPESDAALLEQQIAAKETSRISALQNAGRMQTEAAQQGVLAEGQRAADGQLIRNLPTGNMPRDPSIVQPTGSPVGAFPVDGMPRVPPRYAGNVGPAEQFSEAAQDAASIAAQRKAEKDFIGYQLDALRKTVGPDADKSLFPLLNRPSMATALKDAALTAQEKGIAFPQGPNDKFSVEALQLIKLALDKQLSPSVVPRFGLEGVDQGAIKGTREAFVNWLENKSPQWAAARNKYAEMSQPINAMQIGQFLENKLVPALDEQGRQKAGVYAQALQDAPNTIKRATGAPRFEKLSEALTPDQLAVVNSVKDDLARLQRHGTMATLGNRAAPSAIDLATQSMERQAGGKLPNLLNRTAMIANAIVMRLEGKINRKLAAELAAEMLDPSGVATSMAKEKAHQLRNQNIADAVSKLIARPMTASAIETSQDKQSSNP